MKSQQLQILKQDHEDALLHFKFDKAKEIDRQIKSLEASIPNELETLTTEFKQRQLESQTLKLQSVSQTQRSHVKDEEQRIIVGYQTKLSQLKSQHQSQMIELKRQHELVLIREQERKVPDAEVLFSKSIVLGREHYYDQAREMYQQGEAIRKDVLAEREQACIEQFLKDEENLRHRHERELLFLYSQRDHALSKLSFRATRSEALISRKQNVKTLKASTTPLPRKGFSQVIISNSTL